jgi:hypothetical protein
VRSAHALLPKARNSKIIARRASAGTASKQNDLLLREEVLTHFCLRRAIQKLKLGELRLAQPANKKRFHIMERFLFW